MSDEQPAANSVSPDGRRRSVRAGDTPEEIERRYYTDRQRRGAIAYYVDATIARPAFNDHGDRLVATRADPHAIRHMIEIARHREWSTVALQGAPEFRREAWLVAALAGLTVKGYHPTQRDQQDLDRRLAGREIARSRGGDRPPAADRRAAENAELVAAKVERVVRSTGLETPQQDRVLAAARDRISRWLERGATFEAPRTREPPSRATAERRRDR